MSPREDTSIMATKLADATEYGSLASLSQLGAFALGWQQEPQDLPQLAEEVAARVRRAWSSWCLRCIVSCAPRWARVN